ncbi:hypothetical protein ACFVGN_36975 [Streptomyces sp. NPDC057757]|uniref:hypothetical protein n=1 Tax=Streptomyces sp. NPDC057757 TaxID=3346241 RepID=UPI0036A4A13C
MTTGPGAVEAGEEAVDRSLVEAGTAADPGPGGDGEADTGRGPDGVTETTPRHAPAAVAGVTADRGRATGRESNEYRTEESDWST